ncbi:MAG: Hpt domain-containing protein, partial [Clostridiales bacterium]|nr:Hpt domain-containing protein [Clostridiales bacterium]
MADFDRESMLEMFIYEMSNLLEQLEQIVITGESGFDIGQINEIFRIMHTLKGSAAMMMFDNISTTAHCMEDLFFYLREENPSGVDYSTLTDLILEGMDFIKVEIGKIESGESSDGDGSNIIKKINSFLSALKGTAPVSGAPAETAPTRITIQKEPKHFYKAKIFFEENSEMENIRAYTLVHNIRDKVYKLKHTPEDLISDQALDEVRKEGLRLEFETETDYDGIHKILSQTIFLKSLFLEESNNDLHIQENVGTQSNLYVISLKFLEDAEMENIRAYTLVHNITPLFEKIEFEPKELLDNESLNTIRRDGFKLA